MNYFFKNLLYHIGRILTIRGSVYSTREEAKKMLEAYDKTYKPQKEEKNDK